MTERGCAAGTLLIRVAGTVDVSAVAALDRVLRAVPRGRPVVLDFGAARGLNCISLAVLASEIARAHATVSVRGLAEHHARVLERLGVARVAHASGPAGSRAPAQA